MFKVVLFPFGARGEAKIQEKKNMIKAAPANSDNESSGPQSSPDLPSVGSITLAKDKNVFNCAIRSVTGLISWAQNLGHKRASD